MHILYIHQYFGTSLGSAGTRSYEFSRRWVKQGHRITMVTTTANLQEEEVAMASGRWVKRFTVDGIDVVAACVAYRPQMGFTRRVLAFLFFLTAASWLALFIRKVDVVYATSTPLTTGIPAMVCKWLKRTPFVFEVRDQWPAVPIGMGILKNRLLIKIALWLERTIYSQSSAVVALSPGMAEGVKSSLKRDVPIHMVPNCSDTDTFNPDFDGVGIRDEKGWTEKLVCLHAGAMSMANGLDFIIDVAEKLREQNDVHFVLLGDGSQKIDLKIRVEQSKLSNVELLDSISRRQVPEVFAACDVSLVVFANYPVLEHNSANKFFDSLSAGKTVLLNYSGWQRDMIEDFGAGLGCEQCNIDEFTDKILYLNSHRNELVEMGHKGRILAEERFDRDKLANKVLKVITSL